MQNNNYLKKYYKDNKNYTISDLSTTYKKSETKIIEDILEYLYYEIKVLNPDIKNKEKMDEITKIISWLYLSKASNYNKQNFNKIYKILGLCKSKIEYYKKSNNDFFYTSLFISINDILFNLDNKNSKKLMDSKKDYDFIRYIIFDLKDYSLLSRIIHKYPIYLNNSNNKESIINEVIDYYLNNISNMELSSEKIYFENVIKLFINDEKCNFNKKDKLNNLNKIKNKILNEKNSKNIFYLNEIMNLINKNNEINIDKLKYKYEIFDTNNIFVKFKKNFKDDLIDMRFKNIISIDDKNAGILEDAFSIEKTSNGNTLLNIYITDVASYIKRGSNLDINAKKNIERFYVNENVINLFSEEIANQLSLIKNYDRQAIGYSFEFDQNNKIIKFDIKHCLINVKENYTNNMISKILKYNKKDKYIDDIKKILNLAFELHKERFKLNKEEELKLRKKIQYNNSIITNELMTLVNMYTALLFNSRPELPFIFLNTKKYNIEELNNFKRLLSNNINAVDIYEIIDTTKKKQYYSSFNLGNDKVKSNCYCKITNPLREYVSLENQRLLIEHFINIDKDINIDKEYLYIDNLCDLINNKQLLNKYYIKEVENIKEVDKKNNI